MSPILVLYLVNFFNAIEHLPRAAPRRRSLPKRRQVRGSRGPQAASRLPFDRARSVGDRTCAVGRSMTLNLREIPLFHAALKSDIVTRC